MSRGGNTGNGFDKDRRRAIDSGKKSKRIALDKTLANWLESKLSKELLANKDFSKLNLPKNSTVEESLLTALFIQGLKGNVNATRLIFDRAYGKPKEFIDDLEEHKLIHSHTIITIGGNSSIPD